MSTSSVQSSSWRLVEVGRVVLIDRGVDAGKLAAIVEIIDHNRALIDGPEVQRRSLTLGQATLTPLVVPKLPRGVSTSVLAKKWAASGVQDKWTQSSWAKKIAQRQRRRELTDFERFQVLVLKKQRRFAVRKAVAKTSKA